MLGLHCYVGLFSAESGGYSPAAMRGAWRLLTVGASSAEEDWLSVRGLQWSPPVGSVAGALGSRAQTHWLWCTG